MLRAARSYANEVKRLLASSTTTEASYYPAIKSLLTEILASRNLPFDARASTSERRGGGGVDLPDLALYDGSGDFVVVCAEVKLPQAAIADMAVSTDRNDQVGRYLAQTRVLLLMNVRAVGLLTIAPTWSGQGPVPPPERRLEQMVELWPSVAGLKRGEPIPSEALEGLADLVEQAVTQYAPIAEPESLARILARQARRAKADLPEQFTQAVRGLLDDFGKALGITFVGEEGEEFFRSSLIQTAYYGLFAGWALWRHRGSTEPFHWENLAEYLTIPFLGQLFFEFKHPTRLRELRLAPHLDTAVATLNRVEPSLFFAKFELPNLRDPSRTSTTRAITYFYEPFLEAFDPDLRKELGVWYTPTEIIGYQVRKIDRLLREELGCSRGFADERVVVLDPCCGTGAYLIEVLRCIAGQLEEEGIGAMLGARLLEDCCRRIMGFEILTAPFVIAHLQVYLILAELGARPGSDHRPAIFLTNALTGWNGSEQLKLHFPELQEEHDAAQEIKREAKIIVILGNPPYNRFAGVPLEEEADLVDHYKGIRRDDRGRQVGQSELYTQWGIRKHLLDDLYVRFFRLGETRIGERAEFGVVSFISNYSFYTGRSHPIMRESVLKSFHAIWVDCLNGDKYRTGKVIPAGLPGAGSADQSIFTTEQDPRGIQVGTGITTLLKRGGKQPPQGTASVYYRDFWGRSEDKRRALLESLEMEEWSAAVQARAASRPEGPRAFVQFTPTVANRWKLIPWTTGASFEDWPSLEELFPTAFQGVNPNRGLDGSVVDMDARRLEERIRDYFSELSFPELSRRYPELCRSRARYDPQATRTKLRKTSRFQRSRIVPYHVFPLDLRWIYYETEAKLLNERRPELWANLEENEFLIAVPQPRRYSEFRPLMSTTLFDLHLHDRGSIGFPAEVEPPEVGSLFRQPEDGKRVANLAPTAWIALKGAWKLRGELHGSDAKRLTRALQRLALVVCHAPQYELDHKDDLAQDWAHLPIPKDRELLESIRKLGDQIATLLDPAVDAAAAVRAILSSETRTLAVVASVDGSSVNSEDLVISRSYYGSATGDWRPREPASDEARHIAWGDVTGDLYLNGRVFFRNVPEKVWRYELGGYPVLKKWLGYRSADRRDGNPVTLPEAEHFRGMVHRIAALLLIHEKLDTAYEQVASNAFTADELEIR